MNSFIGSALFMAQSALAKGATRNTGQQEFLESFLESPARPPNSMNFYQLDGYLRAICCGPGLADADEWLPLVFNDDQAQYCDAAEAECFMDAVINLYGFHADQVLHNHCDLPMPACYSVVHEGRINQEQWARGFLQGYIYWEEQWNNLLDRVPLVQIGPQPEPESSADKIDEILYVISTVADAELAVAQGTERDKLDDIFAGLPALLILCGRIGRALYKHRLAEEASPEAMH